MKRLFFVLVTTTACVCRSRDGAGPAPAVSVDRAAAPQAQAVLVAEPARWTRNARSSSNRSYRRYGDEVYRRH